MKQLEWVSENGWWVSNIIFYIGIRGFNFEIIEEKDREIFTLCINNTLLGQNTTLQKSQSEAQKYYDKFLKDMKK